MNYLNKHKDNVTKELLVKLEKTFELTNSKYNSMKLRIVNMLIAKKSDEYDHKI